MQTQQLEQLRGTTVVDPSGDKIGKVEEIYLDEQTQTPEWVLVHTGMFGTKSTFVPLRVGTATEEAGRVRLRKHVVTEQTTVEDDIRKEQIDVDGDAV